MDIQKIIHVDMDAFFAAIEVRDNPELAGKPLIIGALPSERGVVSTCSYEARKFGIRSAMNIKEAYRRCPFGIYMHPNIQKYRAASQKLHTILYSYSDLVEFVALDEGYLDVTGSEQLFGGAEKIGHEIKRKVLEDIGTTCSVGIGYCMMAAKMASEEKKPDGFYMISTPQEFKSLIMDRHISVLSGVGTVSCRKFENAGIYTVRDLLNTPRHVLSQFGNIAEIAIQHANGIDLRCVSVDTEQKSIGNEHTFQTDVTDETTIDDILILIARRVSLRLKFKNLYCKTVTLKIKFSDMKSITRSCTVNKTNASKELYRAAQQLLNKVNFKKPVRLVGISTSNLTDGQDEDFEQISIYDCREQSKAEENENSKLDKTLMDLYRTYGSGSIKTAREIAAENNLYINPSKGK